MATTPALPNVSVIYAFGDSLSDAGNLSIATQLTGVTPVSPPYFEQNYGLLNGNVFSNGPTWVQNLSLDLGLGTLAPSLVNGNDFAYGGAETGSTPQNANNPQLQAISLPSQLAQYQSGVSAPAANALFTLSIGANDLLDILANPSLSTNQQNIDVNDAIANEVSFIHSLIGDGAKNLLVLNVPDLGKTPYIMDGLANGSDVPSASFDTFASTLASEYNAELAGQLATIQGASIEVVNTYQLIDQAVADPAAFGLGNVTTPVWSGSYSVKGSGSLQTTVAATQDQYLFWDHLHPTETGHQAVAALALAALEGTATITATTPGQAVPLSNGNNVLFATAPTTITQSAGASTVISSVGQMTVNATGGSMLIFDSGGGSTVNEAPFSDYVLNPGAATSTITGSVGGSDTIFALSSVVVNDSIETNNLFLGGAAAVSVVAGANATLFAGSAGGDYIPGSSSFFLFGGGGTDSIIGGTASPTVWGNTNERLTASGTAAHGVFVAYGANDSINAATAGGGDAFIAVNEALSQGGGTFSGNTTLVGSSAGGDTFALFSAGSPPPAHTIAIDNWQASDTFFLGNYGTADLNTANAALAAAGSGGATFTLSDQTTITFVGGHPSVAA